MKKVFYIFCFTLFGFLLSILTHALIEMSILHIITSDIDRYADSFVWTNWVVLHKFGGWFLTLAGVGGGFWAGRHFWQVLYVEGRRSWH